MISLWRLFNKILWKAPLVLFDVAIGKAGSLYRRLLDPIFGIGGSYPAASIASGLIVAGLILGLFWLGIKIIRKMRLKNPPASAILLGRMVLWAGCALGVYTLGLVFYLAAQSQISGLELIILMASAASYAVLGRAGQYVLGR